jgi:hypothetical protein
VLRDPESALELIDLCDRNPFAIRVAGERLAARPLLSLRELVDRLRGEEWRLGELRVGTLDVREQLLEAGRRLDRGDRRALRVLSRLGDGDFDLKRAMEALDADEHGARRVLNSLIDAFLIDDVGVSGEDWPWASRRFRLASLLRLAWSAAPAGEGEPSRARRHGALCRGAARPHQAHTIRLLRYTCAAWGAHGSRP